MDIQITLEKEDWRRYQSYIARKLLKNLRTRRSNLWVYFLIVIVTVLIIRIFREFTLFHWPTAILVSIFFTVIAALFFINHIMFKKAFEPIEKGIFCREHFFRFTDQGIECKSNGYSSSYSWLLVNKVDRSQGMVLIYLDTMIALVFPESKLSDPDGFFKFISEQYLKAKKQIME